MTFIRANTHIERQHIIICPKCGKRRQVDASCRDRLELSCDCGQEVESVEYDDWPRDEFEDID